MIVAGLVWAAIAWGHTADFRVKKPSGTYVHPDVIVDSTSPNYKTFVYDGENKSGRSLYSVLEEAKIEKWTSVTVEGLTVNAGDFPRSKPPLFIVRGNDELTFYRPKTENRPDDSRSGVGNMTYRVPLEISAEPGGTPKAGDTVTYRAKVLDGGPQNAYEFTWTRSSSTVGTGRKFKYTYPETTENDVEIGVSAKRESDGVTVAESATAPVDIQAPPPSNSGSSGFGGTGGTTYPGSTSPDYDYDFPDTGGSPSQDIPDTPKTPDPDETPPVEDFGTSVDGELLSATAPLPSSSGDAAPADETPPDPEEAIEEAEEIHTPGALIAAGVVVGLLGLGAGREMETVRPRRLRRPNLSGLRRLSPPWK